MKTTLTKTRFEARRHIDKCFDEKGWTLVLDDNTGNTIEGNNVYDVLGKLIDLFDCSSESAEFEDVMKNIYIAEISVKSVAELKNFNLFFFPCEKCDQVHQYGTLKCKCGEDVSERL